MCKNNIKKIFVDFYWKAKEIRQIALNCGFGAGTLPSGYTEQLCRELYDLDPFNKNNHSGKELKAKDFDAEKGSDLIEIKFNNLITNSVNVKLEKEFDYLYHTFIDFDNDTYTVRVFKGDDVRNKFGNVGEISTPINNFSKNLKPKIDKYKFEKDSLVKIN
ncbi:hypothetical protein ACSXDI_13825 [Clostridium perfringens]|uniref:hypothetical protein n=1 Tax=Clostridium TaxID=1485 RepID=UPI0029093445|nr:MULTISPECIES: hypothetical protein [Clostridium]EGT5618328.1 hypothetical protein [Clostridium perfringens]MDM0866198.1 hypothetical protein [Clostridium perfringens]MDU4427922.1 hypothetical protein [Clostridium sp.]MDU7456297.1 hypothetical protein [Clostridium perfringens]WPQ46718.1 hypothetical protein SK065_04970 [Clostridium perfringens]